MDADSWEYNVPLKWIAGARRTSTLKRRQRSSGLEVTPSELRFSKAGERCS